MDDITKLVLSDSEIASMVARVEYKDKFFVRVRHLTPSAVMALTEECRGFVWDDKRRERVERLDEEKFLAKLGRAIIIDWEGLTLRKLSTMMFLNLKGVPDSKLDENIPATDTNVAAVIRGVPHFDAFLQSVTRDVTMFSSMDREEETVKN